MSAVRMKAPGKKAQLGPTSCFSLSCGFYRYCVNQLKVIYLRQLVPLLTETVSSATTLRIRYTTQSSKQAAPADFCWMIITLPLDGIAFCTRSQPH